MRRRKIDVLESGIEAILKKRLGSFWGVLLGGIIKKLLIDLIAYLKEKWISEDLEEYAEE
jgi:hypothetical protein